MSDAAFQKQYRQEYIAGFEFKQSMLRLSTVTESVIKGNEAVFLVADTGGAEATTRGVNGNIPARTDNLTQNPATLVEWHDKARRTRFNIFASQGDGRRILQEGSIKVMNRKIDDDIIGELSQATQEITVTGTNGDARVKAASAALSILGNNDVDVDEADNMFAVATHAYYAYLMQTEEFTSADWIEYKPYTGPVRKVLRWNGMNWIFHSRLPGVGTATEACFIYHRNAIGHAVNSGDMDVKAGYNDEDDYYWARASLFMGSKLLQQNGIIRIVHDGSAISNGTTFS